MKITDMAIDVDRLENGAWVDETEIEGLRLKVRGANNLDWRKMQQKLLAAVPRKKRLGAQLELEASENIQTQLMLHCCLLDWDGLEDKNGNPIPYSLEQAKTFLTDPQWRRFRDAVAVAANFVADMKDTDAKDAVGNLVQLSSGSIDGERKKNTA